jgi:hypothetical protein
MCLIGVRCENDRFKVLKDGISTETYKFFFQGVAGFNWLTTECRGNFL